MCLAVPAKVININKDQAEIEMLGVNKTVDVSLIPDVEIGDFVIIHAGFAIQIIEKEEAEITQGYWKDYLDKNQ
jgi:hydrogenase expression/formation protein HypC